ncbi:MAG: HAD-IIIA family hydrolase [Elusimicrobia bacterium]|nr:HAD-IIIA family hydrolase [Elusimicrobiota bacterium]
MKVVFLDRDGVINTFPGNGLYVTRARNFHFLPGALEGLRLLTEAGYRIFVISNQAGVGKGVYTREHLEEITQKMLKGVTAAGAQLTGVFYCTCRSSDGCNCRKPRVGNIEKALKMIGGSLKDAPQTYFVGDTEIDIKAGKNAGCRTIFSLSGREDREYMKRWDVRPDHIVEDLYDAACLIIQKNSHPVRDRRRGAQKGR